VDAVPSGQAALETVGYLPGRSRRTLGAWSRAEISWSLARLTIDAAMLAAAAIAAAFGASAAGFTTTPHVWAATFAAIALVILHSRGAYGREGRGRLFDQILGAATAAGLAALAVLALRLLLEPQPELVGDTGRLAAYGAAYIVAGRAVLAWSDAEVRFKRRAGAATLIVGAGVAGRIAAERLAEHPTIGLRPVGFLDDDALGVADGVPVLGSADDLERIVSENGIRHVVVTPASAPYESMLELVGRCQDLGVRISFLAGSGST
jgi:FlaA1/EpsC-like NDP-sugar epimerase